MKFRRSIPKGRTPSVPVGRPASAGEGAKSTLKNVYSMPEQFIQDKNVAVKWRLYGLLNGFWVNGRDVFANNRYFAEKLGCELRTIRRSLEELEEEGLCHRSVHGSDRRIMPGRRTPSVPPRENDDENIGRTPRDLGGRPASAGEDTQRPLNEDAQRPPECTYEFTKNKGEGPGGKKPQESVAECTDIFYDAVELVRNVRIVTRTRYDERLGNRLAEIQGDAARFQKLVLWYLTRMKRCTDHKTRSYETPKNPPALGNLISDAWWLELLSDEANIPSFGAEVTAVYEKYYADKCRSPGITSIKAALARK